MEEVGNFLGEGRNTAEGQRGVTDKLRRYAVHRGTGGVVEAACLLYHLGCQARLPLGRIRPPLAELQRFGDLDTDRFAPKCARKSGASDSSIKVGVFPIAFRKRSTQSRSCSFFSISPSSNAS